MMNLMKHARIVEFIGIIILLTLLDLETQTFSIVMELLPLGNLQSCINKKSNNIDSWAVRVQILSDLCEAVAFLHSSFYSDGREKMVVLHQDLKSANLLLSMEDGKLRGKVADFGLAYLKKVSSDMSKSNSVKHNGGTMMNQAPELFQMNAKFTKVNQFD
jgi:serine/threonine protein kinase